MLKTIGTFWIEMNFTYFLCADCNVLKKYSMQVQENCKFQVWNDSVVNKKENAIIFDTKDP